ncbi:TPA: 50S ribosomal protein L30 [Candidatus Woesearchaeota archaeon]|nr:50S ribosomal protein L30 [Candidatus Woesearchaeota archaeon]
MADKTTQRIAVVQVRGTIGATGNAKATLRSLRLHRQNYCTIIPHSPEYLGMLQRAKDFITWGEIDDATHKLLVDQKGEEFKGGKEEEGKYVQEGGKMLKRHFRLSPPRKGYGRKGTKEVFSKGGALGYRGEKINDLLQRMI